MTEPTEQIPMARPVIGAREEELVLEVLRSGQLSLGQKTLQFEEGLAARVGVRFGRATSSGTAGLHLALRAIGVGEGDEGHHVAAELHRQRELGALRAGRAAVRRHRPGHAEHGPGGRRRGGRSAHEGDPARAHLRLPGRYARDGAARAAARRGCLRGARRGARRRRARRRAWAPAVFAFYANKQLATGEGGMVVTNDEAIAERIASERNQGRAPDMGWLDQTGSASTTG